MNAGLFTAYHTWDKKHRPVRGIGLLIAPAALLIVMSFNVMWMAASYQNLTDHAEENRIAVIMLEKKVSSLPRDIQRISDDLQQIERKIYLIREREE